MRTARRGLVFLASVAIACAIGAGDARADDPVQGRQLFTEGVALFNEGKYTEACAKLEASLKAMPGIGTRGKLAECYEKLGRFASAYAAYKEVAQLAMRAGEAAREQVASERAKALEPKLSYVTVVVTPAHDVPGLVVKRNGREVERAKIGAADPVDAGAVTFEVSAPNRRSFSAQVSVGVGQTAKFEVPALESTAAPPPPSIEPPKAKEESYFPPPETDSTPWQKPVGLVIAGVGGVGLIVGGVFGLSARSKYNGAFDGGGCDRATKQCDASGQSDIDDAKSKATLSTIFFAAGGALAAGGLVLFLTAPSSKRTGVRVVPAMTAGGAAVTAGGSF